MLASDAQQPHLEYPPQQSSNSTKSQAELMGPPELPRVTGEQQQFEYHAESALSRALQQSPARAVTRERDTSIEDTDNLTPSPVKRLLFPSPRKSGEFKTLDESAASTPNGTETPKSAEPSPEKAAGELPEAEEADKENCPPAFDQDNGLADLFNFSTTPFASPRTTRMLAKNLKTPTSAKKSRNALGELSGGEANQDLPSAAPDSMALPVTPSRAPRASPGPLTPFYRELLERVGGSSSSPGQGMHLDLHSLFDPPSDSTNQASFNFDKNIFGSPGQFFNNFLSSEAMLPSDMPMPSSPPVVGHHPLATLDNLIEFYEDSTATSGPGASQSPGATDDAPPAAETNNE